MNLRCELRHQAVTAAVVPVTVTLEASHVCLTSHHGCCRRLCRCWSAPCLWMLPRGCGGSDDVFAQRCSSWPHVSFREFTALILKRGCWLRRAPAWIPGPLASHVAWLPPCWGCHPRCRFELPLFPGSSPISSPLSSFCDAGARKIIDRWEELAGTAQLCLCRGS